MMICRVFGSAFSSEVKETFSALGSIFKKLVSSSRSLHSLSIVSFMVRPAFLMELVLSRTFRLLFRTFRLPLMESFAAASRLSELARTVFCTSVREFVLLFSASVVRFTSSLESSSAD